VTTIIQHDDCLQHDTGPRSPERVQRIPAVLGGLEGLKDLEYLPAPRATAEQISRVHTEVFQNRLRELEPSDGRISVTEEDNIMSRGTLDASLRGSGGICFGIDQVIAGKTNNVFCVVRPPGHHAEQEIAMGFCFFNHVAVGARHAQTHDGIGKIAIIDFDVHHGNGTQAIFENDPSVMFVSSHQMPLYPGSGYAEETGGGNILNLPLAPGNGSNEFRHAWSTLGLPAVHSFEPDMILISAGFDAHYKDPLGQLEVQDIDYRWITDQLMGLAQDSAGGRLVSILEGGYNLEALATASRSHVESLIDNIS
jgi:acetoin utilization deacetylase AcuC-like enzyme